MISRAETGIHHPYPSRHLSRTLRRFANRVYQIYETQHIHKGTYAEGYPLCWPFLIPDLIQEGWVADDTDPRLSWWQEQIKRVFLRPTPYIYPFLQSQGYRGSAFTWSHRVSPSLARAARKYHSDNDVYVALTDYLRVMRVTPTDSALLRRLLWMYVGVYGLPYIDTHVHRLRMEGSWMLIEHSGQGESYAWNGDVVMTYSRPFDPTLAVAWPRSSTVGWGVPWKDAGPRIVCGHPTHGHPSDRHPDGDRRVTVVGIPHSTLGTRSYRATQLARSTYSSMG